MHLCAPPQAMAAALREREAALLTVQSIEEDLDKRRRAAAALDEAGPRRWGGGEQCIDQEAGGLRHELPGAVGWPGRGVVRWTCCRLLHAAVCRADCRWMVCT